MAVRDLSEPWFDDDYEIDREPLCLGCGDDCSVDDDGYCDDCAMDEDDY